MFERIRYLWKRAADEEAVLALSERELADLGVSRDQALALVRMPPEVPERVAAMAKIFGVTEADLAGNRADWEELLTTCAACAETRICRRFLARDERDPANARFCPNAPHFEGLRAERSDTSACPRCG